MRQVSKIHVPAVTEFQRVDHMYQRVVTRPPSVEEVVLIIDIDTLVKRLGIKAVLSGSGKTAYLGGLVKVTHTRSTKS